jgi:hypothetical protein
MAEAEVEAIGVKANTSAPVSFSVGNGFVLTIATGASLEQDEVRRLHSLLHTSCAKWRQ